MWEVKAALKGQVAYGFESQEAYLITFIIIVATTAVVTEKFAIIIAITIKVEFVMRKVQVQVILQHVFHLVDLHETIEVVDF